MSEVTMNRLHIYLPLATIKQVRTKARKLGIPVSEFIRRAVQDFLKN